MQARSVERAVEHSVEHSVERSVLATPARKAAKPPPPLLAASPPLASGSRYGVLAELESVEGLAMLSQDSAEPSSGGGGGDAVQQALSALKLGAIPGCVCLHASRSWEQYGVWVACVAGSHAVLSVLSV